MVRTQVQLDEQTYEALRRIAHRQHTSMSSVVREMLHEQLAIPESHPPQLLSFIASGASGHNDTAERHDEILAEAFGDFSLILQLSMPWQIVMKRITRKRCVYTSMLFHAMKASSSIIISSLNQQLYFNVVWVIRAQSDFLRDAGSFSIIWVDEDLHDAARQRLETANSVQISFVDALDF